jgi:type I restriction enzyme M protein
VSHGIDKPNLWHGNTLTGMEIYGGLFEGTPAAFDVVLTNPPFGGKEGKEAQTNFDYPTSATQVLFLQHVLRSLRDGGRCSIVLDEGLLFRTHEEAFVKTKRKLLDECDLWCIVSLPAGVFTAAGAGMKTNLLFFTKGRPTRNIWYYDLSDLKVRKKSPLTLAHFEEFFPAFAAARRQRTQLDGGPRRTQTPRRRGSPSAQGVVRREGPGGRPMERAAKELKKAVKRNDAALAEAESKLAALNREARELANRAKQIEDAVYDLKAVNPHRKPKVDTRHPRRADRIHRGQGSGNRRSPVPAAQTHHVTPAARYRVHSSDLFDGRHQNRGPVGDRASGTIRARRSGMLTIPCAA